MANDSVGKISLDMEVDGDLSKQISEAASKIGENIQNSLKNIGNLNFKGIADTISNTISKSIENSMKNIQKTIESTINKAMSNIKVKIPIDFEIPKNIPIPNNNTRITPASPRAPPSNINLEALKTQIENLTQSLDIINAKIEQQKEKLAQLKESYNMAFDGARKNKLLEQILQTEATINKLIAQSDKAGFKLADLDEQFERLSGAAKSSDNGINSVSNGLSRLAALANISDRALKNISNNTKQATNSVKNFGQSTNNATRGNYGFLDSMIRWGIVFPAIMGGLGSLAKFIGSSLMVNAQFAGSLNQIRSNLYTAFMPIYEAVLPALNSLMSALATVTAYIASFISQLFGKTYTQSFGAAQAMQQSIGAYSQAEKQAKKTADSLGGVSKSAKSAGDAAEKAGEAAKKGLAGFDAINKLSDSSSTKAPKTTTPAGGGVETPIVPMANMTPIEATTAAWADKFKKILAGLWTPFKQAWAVEGVNTINAAKHALQGIEDLLGAIGKSFYTVWTNGTGERILINLLKILQDILNIVGDIGVTFANAWNKGNIGTQIVQHIANALNNVLSLINKMLQSIRHVWAEEGPNFANIFMQALNATSKVIENVTQKLGWIWDHGGQHAFEGLVKLGLKVGELALFIYTNFVVPFVNWFVNIIAPAIAPVLNALGTLFDTVSKIINWLMGSGKPVLDIIITVVSSFALAWNGVTLAIKGFYGTIELINKFKDVVNIAFTALTSPIGLVIIAIAGVIAIGVLLYQHWDEISGFLKNIFNNIKNVAVNAFNSIKDNIGTVVPIIAGILFGPFGAAIGYVATHFNQVKSTCINAFNGLMSFMGGLPGRAMSIVSSIGRSIIGGFNSAISFITSLPSRALQWGRDFISGLINGIESKVGSIVNAVSGIADTITSYLHFSVPDVGPLKKYESWMPDFMYGLASGINANKDIVTNAINGLSTDMSIGVKTASIQQPTLSMVGSNSTSKPNANSSIEEFKKAIIEAIIEALKELKQNDNGKSSNNNGNSNGDLIFKISDTEFGRIAIAAINKVQRQAGVTLLKV